MRATTIYVFGDDEDRVQLTCLGSQPNMHLRFSGHELVLMLTMEQYEAMRELKWPDLVPDTPPVSLDNIKTDRYADLAHSECGDCQAVYDRIWPRCTTHEPPQIELEANDDCPF